MPFDFVSWLNNYYFVLLDHFPLFLRFFTSLIKFILWNAGKVRVFLQEPRGEHGSGGRGDLSWEDCIAACVVADPLLSTGILFSLHESVILPASFLQLISSFISLCLENMFEDMISVFLNLLRFVLCPNIQLILEKVLRASGKNVYSAAFGWNFCVSLLNPSNLMFHLSLVFFVDFMSG